MRFANMTSQSSSIKILVIQLKMIGDVLISSIICNNLRKQYPNAQIDYLIYPFTKPVTENNPNIDNLILFPNAARDSKLELLKFIGEIRNEKYNIVIDAYSKLESCLVTMLSGADRRIGFRGKGVPFSYNEKVEYPEIPNTIKGLAIERREKLIEKLVDFEPDLYPKIFLLDSEIDAAKQLFENHSISDSDSVIMVSILGSDYNKTYPHRYMAQLIDRIAAHENVKILFNYIPNQSADAKAVYELCAETTQQKIIFDLIGADLRSFMAIMSLCKMIVGNDGGAVNIAKALNKPSFTIFSPWIEKISWSIFEDGVFHKAVHLNDFEPELIASKSRKELQKEFENYYSRLTPEMILPELGIFLKHHLG